MTVVDWASKTPSDEKTAISSSTDSTLLEETNLIDATTDNADDRSEPVPVEETAGVSEKECSHEYEDGFCKKCGQECDHEWENGICSKCSTVCSHVRHYRSTHHCTVCGITVSHNLVNAQCTRCGYQPRFAGDWLPDEYYEECDEQGTVLTLNYVSPRYNHDENIVKTAKIYLPYGYNEHDKTQRYNVAIMVHGNNGTESSFIDLPFYCTHLQKQSTMKNIYDRMIKNGDCEPFIVVSITTYIYPDGNRIDTDGTQLGPELREVLLPYIADHYNTYAEDGSLESLQAARQHFGIAGFSNGAIRVVDTGILRNFDIIGNFGYFSGSAALDYVVQTINAEENKNYPVYCLFLGAGLNEGAKYTMQTSFSYILERCPDRLSFGTNAFYVDVDGEHDWKTCSTEMYNTLLVMFQDVAINPQ